MIRVDKPTDKRGEDWRRKNAGKREQPPIFDIPQSRGKLEAQQVAKGEHVVGGAARIGVMLLDPKAALVVQQAIEDIRRLARGRGDDLGVIRAERIGNMGVERHARLVAVVSVHICERLAMAAGLKILTV